MTVDAARLRGAARSVLAAAQLLILVLTPAPVLFAQPPTDVVDPCGGPGALSMWCLAGGGGAPGPLVRLAAIAVLGLVVIGYRPRWTCVPHWYVAFSLQVSVAFPDGGMGAAQIAAALLVLCCLGDRRRWHWAPAGPVTPGWTGATRAAHLGVRVQLAVIYGWAAAAKLTSPSWREGTAVPATLHDPIFGLPPALWDRLEPLLVQRAPGAALTWSSVALEIGIAASMLAGRRARRIALGAAVLLHGAIIVTMGLAGFGLTMIGFVLLSCADDDAPNGPGDPGTAQDAGQVTAPAGQ